MFAGHSGTPLGNKSALDDAVMMATMSEFLREQNLEPSTAPWLRQECDNFAAATEPDSSLEPSPGCFISLLGTLDRPATLPR
ncbi:hypothetical protein ACFRFL_32255 [Streptomyces sp. NPDC056708]|uniref:hypothetical protein n=1 Tax=unclassified Streptomyces TaxID=2593676 RepID=UPI0036B46382